MSAKADDRIDFKIEQKGTISSTQDLLDSISEIRGQTWYRGHSNVDPKDGKYKLVPMIVREHEYNSKKVRGFELQQERNLLHRFRRRAYPHMGRILNEWEALFLARHHGLPTRLLDWTANPLVALYFACSEHISKRCKIWGITRVESESNDLDMLELETSMDGASSPLKIYRWGASIQANTQVEQELDSNRVTDNLKTELEAWRTGVSFENAVVRKTVNEDSWLIENNGYEYIVLREKSKLNVYLHKEPKGLRTTEDAVKILHPFYNSPRMVSQGGIFTLHSNPKRELDSYQGIGFSRDKLDVKVLRCWDIGADAKKNIIEELESLGVNRRTIYPDLGGLARGLWETEVLRHGIEEK